ncbi:T9SS type A sorting domain-containing protein [Reichenbachiella sp.]|uniref:T9SS type A sorting domain-containing protein n=1 Tax=Reichenbachiella sp. TaxID=2184521 RepID=UPI003B5C8E4A
MSDFFEILRSTSALIRKQKIQIFCVFIFLCSLVSLDTIAQTNTWDGSASTNWNTAANWSLNLVPIAAHDVVIPNNFDVIVNTAAVCATLTIEGGNQDTFVDISGTNSLTVSGDINIGAGTGFGDNKTLDVAAGTLTCNSIIVTATGSGFRTSGISVSTGTVNVGGNITMGDANCDFTFSGAGTLNLEGSFTGGNLTPSTGTVNIIGNNQTIDGYNFNDINFNNSGDASIAGDMNIGGDLTINSVGSIDFGLHTHNLAGDWTNDNGTLDLSSGTIVLDGTAQTIGGTNSTTFNNLSLEGSGTKTFGLSTTIGGTLSITTGVVANLGTFTDHTCNALSLENVGQTGGTWGSSGSAAANTNDTFFAATAGVVTAAMDGPTTFYSRQTGNWNNATTWSTVTYGDATNTSGTFPQIGDIVNIGNATIDITVNVNATCGSISFLENVGESPVLQLSPGIQLDIEETLTIPRTSFLSGEINTVNVGDGILNVENINFSGGGFFGEYQMLIGAGTATVTGNVTSDVNLTFPVIEFTGGAGELILHGDFLEADVVTLTTNGNGTIEYAGTGDQEISNFTYNNLILSGGGTKTVAGALDINGDFTMESGVTFVPGSFTHTFAGDWNNNGATFTNVGSTISFDGTTAQSITGSQATNFHNLSLSGTNTVSLIYATTINATLGIGLNATADLQGITTHTAKTLSFDGGGQIPGTWGNSASAATNTNDTYFSATAGIVTVTNTIYYAAANGNWNSAASWSTVDYGNGTNTATYPVTGDIALIGGDFDITVAADAACAFVEYQIGAGNTNNVIISGGATLTVSDAVNIGANDGDINTMNVSAGILNTVDLIFSPDDAGAPVTEISISTGTATISGDMINSGPDFLGDRTSAFITFSGAGLLQIAGDFVDTNDGELTASTGTIEYNGSFSQTIANFTYYNLNCNNTAIASPQLTLAGDVIVDGTLQMTAGIVDLNENTLSLGNGASASLIRVPSTTTNWVYNGTLGRHWPASTDISSSVFPWYGLFPIGSDTDYRPMEFNSTAQQTGAGTVSVTHTHRESVTELNPYYTDNDDDIEVKDNSSFEVTNTSTGGTYDVSVSMTGYSAGGDINDIRLAKNAGSTSVNAVGTHASASGTASNPTGNRTGVTSAELAGDWRITSVNINDTPLPIDLISFTGQLNEDHIRLVWSTASEIDNDYFELERSYDGESYKSLGTVSGSGNSNQKMEYSLKDHNYHEGVNYYRLKQVDFDGNFEIFKPIAISAQNTQQAQLSIYPNPTKSKLQIRIDGIDNKSKSLVTISDYMGKMVFHETLSPSTKQWSLENLNTILVPGIYLLQVESGSTILKKKFIQSQ